MPYAKELYYFCMAMTEQEFCKTVEWVSKPERKMWLRTGSFEEVLAYLVGYAHGARLNTHGHHTFTGPFRHWLAEKFPAKTDILTWEEYRLIFPDEEEAIANLPILYKEFAESDTVRELWKVDAKYSSNSWNQSSEN